MQADDEFKEYKPKLAFFFPGQGAQTVGMAEARSPTALLVVHHNVSA